MVKNLVQHNFHKMAKSKKQQNIKKKQNKKIKSKNDCKCEKQITKMKRLLKKALEINKGGGTGNTKVLRKLQYMASQNAQKGY